MFYRRSHAGAAGIGAGMLGLAAGAALIYYLYATESGEDKRKQFKKYTRKIKDKVGDAKDTVVEFTDRKEDFADLASRMKDHLKEMKDDIEDTFG